MLVAQHRQKSQPIPLAVRGVRRLWSTPGGGGSWAGDGRAEEEVRGRRVLGTNPAALSLRRAWWWPSSTASSTGRCSWRFRRSGGSGTCVSVHCAPCPSAAPPASAPAASPTAPRPAPRSRAGAPAGPASSERSEQGHHGHRPRWVLREQDTASGQSISPQAA